MPALEGSPPFEGSEAQKSAFEALHLFEYLEQDDRASYVVDLHAPPESNPVYWNPVIRRNRSLRDRINGLRSLCKLKDSLRHPTDWAFMKWQLSPDSAGHAASCRYGTSYWIATTMRQRWRVISAVLPVQNLSSETHEARSVGASFAGTPLANEAAHMPGISSPQATDNLTSVAGRPSSSPSSSVHGVRPKFPDVALESSPPRASTQDPLDTTRADLPPISRGISSYFEFEPIEDRFLTQAQSRGYGHAVGSFDWTRPDPSVAITPFVKFFRNFDWAGTELGPMETWSPTLRRFVLMLMTDPRPAAMFIGPQRIVLYNEGYRYIAGSKHPWIMGKPYHEAWAELGDTLEPAFLRAAESGLPTQEDDGCFFLERATFLEETYFRFSLIPLAFDGEFAVYNPCFETTRQCLTNRRMGFLLSVSAELAGSKEPAAFWHSLQNALDASPREVPFALMFSARTSSLDQKMAAAGMDVARESWVLEGNVGYEEEALATIRSRFASELGTEKLIPSFDYLIHQLEPTLLRCGDGSLPELFVHNVLSRTFGDRGKAAVLIPICSTGDHVSGFLLLGINPRRPYDSDYQDFVQLLTRQLATAMASAVLLDNEAQESRMARLDRLKQTEKTLEAEQRFRRMADLAPVAMFHFDAAGMPIYCNDMWYAITEYPRGTEYPMGWYNVIHPEDRASMDAQWAKLCAGTPVSFEIRLRKSFKVAEIVGGEKVEGSTWILVSAYSQRSEDGTVGSILGCMTDISRQKWAEDFQNRRKNEALELKRQQESFIDMTTHEMRNPLSAIIQCTDSIATSLGELEVVEGNASLPEEVVASNLDSAQTIALCAQHQTRIIDDILTLSKMDSSLLRITPVEVQPSSAVEYSLKIFNAALRKNGIDLKYHVEQSYSDLAIDWVMLDPSRVLQILINLLSNAIKFTSTQPTREIIVSLAASQSRPTSIHGVKYLPSRPNRQEPLDTAEWGTGELLYLQIQVKDTGKGLDENERSLLFQRFSQTSLRTHVQYGGSGLGLFISRQLAEIQGGEIGVLSEAGVGSTFAFFVKTRRTDAPSTTAPENIPGRSQQKARGFHFNIEEQKALNPTAFGRLPDESDSPSLRPKERRAPLAVSDKAKHVLVVEDNLVNQKVLSKQLKGVGCVVSVANHGGEALKIIEKSRFCVEYGSKLDVVLMDLEMPVMDGLECTKRIREMEKLGKIRGHVPVIAVTANARREQILTAKNTGMDGVVIKPFRILDLIPQMEKIASDFG